MEQQGQNPDPRLRNLNFPSGQPQTLADEALQFGFELMVEQGFKGTALDLEKLLREDEEALEFTYGLFVDNNFQGDLDDFKGLLGMEKKPIPKEDPPPSEQQALLDLLNSPTQNISTPTETLTGTIDSTLDLPEEDKPPTEEEAKAREERDQQDIQQALKFARESEDQSIGRSFGNSLSNFLVNLEGSDGRAKIEIKKIGYVEPTSNKTILLYPGSYEFVAKCRNHKDNLKKVQIPIDDKKIIVRIGCGEEI